MALCRRKDTPDNLTDTLNREMNYYCTSKGIVFLEWGNDKIINSKDPYHPSKANMIGMMQRVLLTVGCQGFQSYKDFDEETTKSLKASQGLIQ